jgi:FkbM family methyltransferase
MNVVRFVKKCVFAPNEALLSVRLVARSFYGRLYWRLKPDAPLEYYLPERTKILLEPRHSFTQCFWPGVIAYEPDVQQLLRIYLKPGMVFVDCGANVGLFSLMAGGLVGPTGKVVSIEANPDTVKLLNRNLAANGLPEGKNCAVSATNGTAEFLIASAGDVYGTLKSNEYVPAESKTISVTTRTLDDIVQDAGLAKVDFIKIDVEGGEIDCLRGADKTLRNHKPMVVLEYGTSTWPGFNHTPEELIAIADNYGYELKMLDVTMKTLVPVSVAVWSSGYANVVMLPKS